MADVVIVADRYELLRPLGSGSFGRTFLAHDRTFDRHVAIKVLDPAADWKARDLFKRESAVLQGLRHQAIPEVHALVSGAWEGGNTEFLVMEYIEGMSLAQVIDEPRVLPFSEVVHLFLELLGVLDYLHRRAPPILHRDIKPSNIIMRADGEPVLVDFGSVRRTVLGADESGSTIVGTYGYMPYEQYMGQAAPSSDLYALAATFLHLLTGRPPREWLNDEGRIIVPANLSNDGRLGPVLARMLQPSPTDRLASAHEVREAMWRGTETTGGNVPAGAPRSTAIESVALGPAPRTIEGETAALLDRVAPTAWDLADSSTKQDVIGASDVAWAIFLGVITVGIVPLIFVSVAHQRRRRLTRFFRNGTVATARVINFAPESTAMGQKLTRVGYEFSVDGKLRRDSDLVLPVVAARWVVGDSVSILYHAAEDYDSVIISTS